MKVLLYAGSLKLVEKSGVGQALLHQRRALESVGIPFTTDEKEFTQIVHINTIFPNSYRISKRCRRNGKKVIYYAHSTKEDFKNSFKGSNMVAPLFKWWIKRCYNTGNVLITPTEYSKKILESYGIKKKIYVISNGIDLDNYQKSSVDGCRFREKYGYSPDDKVIISVGHYINRKGIKDFVALAKELPDYKFIWFGYTPPAARTRDINSALKDIPDNLKLPGLATQDELRAAYSGSDLFLFLTHEETEGIVLLEALAMNLQVLIRDIPIYEDSFTDGINCYKASSSEEFRNKIKKILSGELSSTIKNGYDFVSERNIPVIGEKLKAIYDDLLKTQISSKE